MRTSLNEIKTIECYLFGKLTYPDKRDFEECIRKDESIGIQVFLQQKIYRLLPFYNRRKIKAQAEQFHYHLFNHPEHAAFRESIIHLF